MSRLTDELRNDPGSVFEFEADLPSGNQMLGTVGPMVGSSVVANLRFRSEPSDEDITVARECLDQVMGSPAKMSHVSRTAEERAEAVRLSRKFLGGGQG